MLPPEPEGLLADLEPALRRRFDPGYGDIVLMPPGDMLRWYEWPGGYGEERATFGQQGREMMSTPWEYMYGPRREAEEWSWQTYGRPLHGYEIARVEAGRPPWGVPRMQYGGGGGGGGGGGVATPQYPITLPQLEGLVESRRTRSWIHYVLSAMGLMPPGAQQPTYSPYAGLGAQRRPTQFYFPPYMGGY